MNKSPQIIFYSPLNSGESDVRDAVLNLSNVSVDVVSNPDVVSDTVLNTSNTYEKVEAVGGSRFVVLEDGTNDEQQEIVDELIDEIGDSSAKIVLVSQSGQRVTKNWGVNHIEPLLFVSNKLIQTQLKRLVKVEELESATYDSTVLQRLVHSIIDEIESANSREEIELNTITEIVQTIDECVFAWTGVIDNDSRKLRPRAHRGTANISPPVIDLKNNDGKFSIPIKEPIRNSSPTFISNAQYSNDIPEKWRDTAVSESYNSFAVLPLMYKQYRYGVIVLYFDVGNPFTQSLITGLNMLCELVSLSIFSMEAASDATEMEAEIDELEQRIGQFMSVLSHDLRNPLNAAQGYTDMYLKDGNEEHLQWVEKSHSRIEQLITDMLKLLKEGEPITSAKNVPVKDVAREAWELVDTESASIDIDTEFVATMNASRCQRLFEILFNNAIEHGGDDVRITIGTIEDDDVEGFYISDNGVGLPELSSRNVFHHGYSTDNNGTGLGLTIAQNIVQSHGWKIDTCESGSGGARFNIIVNESNSSFEPV